MTRFLPKILIMAAILTASGLSIQDGQAASPARGENKPAVHSKKSTATHKKHTRKHKKHRFKKVHANKRVSKLKAITVLREYLPEIADLHEAKAKGQPASSVPVPDNFDTRSPFSDAGLRYDLVKNIDTWLGTRYRYGGSSKRGVDCSGFTSAVVSATLKRAFTGSSRVQAARFVPIFDTDSLQFGDMVFFTGRNKRANRIGHVAIFLGNGVFAHSSTGRGVLYSHITEGYYTERFRWGGRFMSEDYPVERIVHAHVEVGQTD